MNKIKIAIIGGGNMGEAILAAVLRRGLAGPQDVALSDVSAARRDYIKEKYRVAVGEDNREAAAGKDIVILAVKPQQLAEVAKGLKGGLKPAQLVLSIIAGATVAAISRGLGHRCIVRAMPNTPAQVGAGITAWMSTPEVGEEAKEHARAILGAMGKEIFFDDEKYLDMATAVSGSGPAYFFLLAECLADAAAAIGLTAEAAGELVLQTMRGAAELLAQSGEKPAELRRKVTSPGGTTARAIGVFEAGGLAALVGDAVRAAYERAKELGA